jgi:hypothetical protein
MNFLLITKLSYGTLLVKGSFMPKAKSKATKPAEKAKASMLVNVVLDRSGSMARIRAQTVTGYNEYLNGLKSDKTTDYNITLIQFDSAMATSTASLTVNYADKPLAQISDLTLAEYEPRGMTPLYDAIGECVRRVDSKGRPVITVIITDGQENASHEFTRESIKSLIQEKEKEGWTFVFLGADIDSYKVGGSIGTQSHSTANFSKSRVADTYRVTAQATMMRSANVQAHGAQAAQTMAFYTNDMKSAMVGEDLANNLNTGGNVTTGGGSAAVTTFHKDKLARRAWTTSE